MIRLELAPRRNRNDKIFGFFWWKRDDFSISVSLDHYHRRRCWRSNFHLDGRNRPFHVWRKHGARPNSPWICLETERMTSSWNGNGNAMVIFVSLGAVKLAASKTSSILEIQSRVETVEQIKPMQRSLPSSGWQNLMLEKCLRRSTQHSIVSLGSLHNYRQACSTCVAVAWNFVSWWIELSTIAGWLLITYVVVIPPSLVGCWLTT